MSKKQRCMKVRYKDKHLALRVIRLFAKFGTREVKPIRAYPCNLCKGWHITSKPRL